MEKRIYKKTGESISLLGYGTMRLPTTPEDPNEIDFEKGKKLIDYAYTHGVNYFDTAYRYHGGKSELFVGEALSAYPRDTFYLADKMPGWMIGDGGVARAKEIFADQLEKCRVEYFDFYLCHALSDQGDFVKTYLDTGVLDYLKEEQAAGRIRHLGFSFHGSVSFFRFMMELRSWDFCQIQLNYLDWDDQSAKELYALALEHGVQLIIMEPVRGGALATLCDSAVSLLKEAAPARSVPSWAIRFVASLPNVLCVLSGMGEFSQVEDNVSTMTDFAPLTEADREVLSRAITLYKRNGVVPCTACRYCFECPKEIAIPEIFAIYNEAAANDRLPSTVGGGADSYEEKRAAFLAAYDTIPQNKQAHNCIRCKKCMEHCPQSIRIPGKLSEIATLVASLR